MHGSEGFDRDDHGLSRKAFLARGALGVGGLTGIGAFLSACGGGSGSEPTAATTGEGNGGAAELTLRQWHTSTPDAGLGKGFIATGREYERANKGQTVEFEAVPFAQFVASGVTACRAKKLATNVVLLPAQNFAGLFPCVVMVNDDAAGELRSELTGWEAAVTKPGELSEFSGYPVGGQGTIWYYNKELFERAGLDPEKAPVTWDEFADAAEKLKAIGVDPIGISGADGATPSWMWQGWSAQFYPTVDDVAAFATGETQFDDPRTMAALEAVAETYDRGWWSKNFKDKAFADVEGDFVKGRVGMVNGIITDIMSWSVWDAKMGQDKYGVFSAPLREGATSSEPVQYFTIAIVSAVATDSENVQAASNYARYLASAEAQSTLLKDAGMFPNRKDVDIGGVSGSKGAARISEILDEYPNVDVIFSWLNSNAQGIPGAKITSAVSSGDLEGLVREVNRAQNT